MRRPLLIAVVGPTNSGKTTLMQQLDRVPGVGTIQVGKELRRRHAPEYFEGLAAMEKTEPAVWSIFREQYVAAVTAGAHTIFCDGQPRMAKQVNDIYERYGEFSLIQLYAPQATLKARAALRDESDAARALSAQRLTNDYIQLYDVLAEFFLLYPPHLHHNYEVVHTNQGRTATFERVRLIADIWGDRV